MLKSLIFFLASCPYSNRSPESKNQGYPNNLGELWQKDSYATPREDSALVTGGEGGSGVPLSLESLALKNLTLGLRLTRSVASQVTFSP